MLTAMSRWKSVVVAAVGLAGLGSFSACGSKSADNKDTAKSMSPADPGGKIAVPGGSATPAPPPSSGEPNPQFSLKPDEGTLTIDKAEAKAGAEATANVRVDPAPGYHVSMDYPTSLKLEAPADVTLAKAELSKADGSVTEKQLAIPVRATAGKPGTYEIKGTFKFGVCDKDSCHPKKQPITIQVVAN
jgi:hypothetical protein